MSEFLFYLVRAAVFAAVTIAVRYFVPWIKEKIEATKYAWITKWIANAVRAMEQTMRKSGTGPERKVEVVKFIKKLLVKKNLSITDEQLDLLIEAAVWAMNNGEGDEK